MFFDIIHYFIPYTLFEWTFFSIILLMAIYTIVSVRKYAHEDSWRESWTEIKGQGLTIHHGSIQVLSEKVATRYERMADSLPSMMLIIGLLGTFVGLGLALNKASLIITQGSSSDMESAMTELMKMMQGLGTKFKTSSWGIIGYLSFSAWIGRYGYESKRLVFCANMIHDELNQELTYKEQIKQLHERHLRAEQQNGEHILRVLTELQVTRDNHQKHNLLQLKELQNINRNMSTLENLEVAANRIESSANVFAQVAQNLDTTVKQLSGSITQTFDVLQNNINEMLETTTSNLMVAVDRISSTTDHMSDRLQSTLNDVQTGLNDMMTQSNEQLVSSSEQLQSTIKGMDTTITMMREGVTEILTESSQSMNMSINTLNGDMRKILTQLEEHISTSMSLIGMTIKDFTGQVSHLLGEVEDNLESAMSMQTQAVTQFRDTVGVLQSELNTTLETTHEAILGLTSQTSHLIDARDLFISSQDKHTKHLVHALIGDSKTPLSAQLTQLSDTLKTSQEQRATQAASTSIARSVVKPAITPPPVHTSPITTSSERTPLPKPPLESKLPLESKPLLESKPQSKSESISPPLAHTIALSSQALKDHQITAKQSTGHKLSAKEPIEEALKASTEELQESSNDVSESKS